MLKRAIALAPLAIFLAGCNAQQIGEDLIKLFLPEAFISNLRSLIITGALVIILVGMGFDLINVILSQVGLTMGFLLGDPYSMREAPVNLPQFILMVISRLFVIAIAGILFSMSNDIVLIIENLVKPAR